MGDLAALELEHKAAAVRTQLADALGQHGRLAYSNSLGAEAMVLTDIIWSPPAADRRLQHRYRPPVRGDP